LAAKRKIRSRGAQYRIKTEHKTALNPSAKSENRDIKTKKKQRPRPINKKKNAHAKAAPSKHGTEWRH